MYHKKSTCGGYDAEGKGTYRDALIIPSLKNQQDANLPYSNVCGESGFGSDAASKNLAPADLKTVCCKLKFPYSELHSVLKSDSFFQPKLYLSWSLLLLTLLSNPAKKQARTKDLKSATNNLRPV